MATIVRYHLYDSLVFSLLIAMHPKTIAGHPLAWVNNQFQQYVYDVTDYLASPLQDDQTLHIDFESPLIYGQNISSRLDVQSTIAIDVRVTVLYKWHSLKRLLSSSNGLESVSSSARFLPILDGIGFVFLHCASIDASNISHRA